MPFPTVALPTEVSCSPPPIGLLTKMQNKKNTMVLALLRQCLVLEGTKKGFNASFKTYV